MARNEIYRVTGRYMTGSEVTAYHLVNDAGGIIVANKEKVILMIGRGQIENMRVQYSGDEVIIRGRGTNLKTLPIFDLNKDEFRHNNTPKQGNTPKTTKHNPMSQYRLLKRVMFKTSCIGYIVADAANRELRLTKDRVFDLALKGYFINISAQKYIPKGESEYKVVIRGIDCDIKSLPVVYVDQKGNVIDDSKSNEVITRMILVRKPGILYNNQNKTKSTFVAGDYIICTPAGGLGVFPSAKSDRLSMVDAKVAACDVNLGNVANYSIEFFGDIRKPITPAMVSGWRIIKVRK